MKQPIKTTEAIFPMPVLLVATYNEDGTVDVMNAAGGTMLDRERVAPKEGLKREGPRLECFVKQR